MAFNIGDLGSFDQPDFSQIADMGGPPRKISLTVGEANKVRKIKKKFDGLDFQIETLFDLFNDWQSSKTKSVKRFVISVSFLLTMALIAGANIVYDIEVLRVPISNGHEEGFLIALLVIHFSAFLYYIYLRAIDLSVQKAKIDTIEDDLEECKVLVREIDKIIAKNNISSVGYLFNDFTSPMMGAHSTDKQVYEAVKFYDEKLKQSNQWKKWGEWAEIILLYLFYSAGIIAIISSFYG